MPQLWQINPDQKLIEMKAFYNNNIIYMIIVVTVEIVIRLEPTQITEMGRILSSRCENNHLLNKQSFFVCICFTLTMG